MDVIDIEGLNFDFGGPPVLEGVNLKLEERDFVAMVGPNGGGKTTLLKLILGLLKPVRGLVRVFGQPPDQVRSRLGYMPQNAHLDPSFPVTALEVVRMGRLGAGQGLRPLGRQQRPVVERALDQVGLLPLAQRPLHSLSGGQRQRVLIARALASDPDLLILDEPTSNVDAKVETELYELLSRLNQRITVLVVTHDLGFVSPFVNRVACVNRQVFIHPTSDVTGEVISRVYGRQMHMVRHDHRHDGRQGGCLS